jgi:hypothetical protein
MRLVSTAIVRERDRDREQVRERSERRGGAKGKQITEPREGYAIRGNKCVVLDLSIPIRQRRRSSSLPSDGGGG